MNHKFKLSLLCAAVLLAGCGDNSSSSGTSDTPQFEDSIQDLLGRDGSIDFVLSGTNANVPVPSSLLLDPTDHTLNIPVSPGEPTGLNNPSVAMGEADGWSTVMPFSIDLNFKQGVTLLNDLVESGYSQNVTDGILVAKISNDPQSQDKVYTPLFPGKDFIAVSSDLKNIKVLPVKGLEPNATYIYALKQSIKDSNGDNLGTSPSYAMLKSAKPQGGDLSAPQKMVWMIENTFGANGVEKDDIIYSSMFTTASVGQSIKAVAQEMTKADPSKTWEPGHTANPNNIPAEQLKELYTFNNVTQIDFGEALLSDQLFLSLFPNAQEGLAVAEQMKNLYLLAKALTKLKGITVYRGTVKLPYFLSNNLENDQWKTQPWRSAMPSALKILSVLSSGSKQDQAYLVTQLVKLGFSPENLSEQLANPANQAKLFGAKLFLANGEQLDPERILTKYSTLPQIRSVQDVPFLMFVPEVKDGDNGEDFNDNLPLLQYQHGITGIKETSYLFALEHIASAIQNPNYNKPYALIAIDQPLHGQRALSKEVVTTPSNPTPFMNLEYLPVARDNIRQGAIDGLGLAYAVQHSPEDLSAFSTIDTSNISLMGHSIGAITGISSYAAADVNNGEDFHYTSATLANPGAVIAPFLLESQAFSGQIKHSVSYNGVPDYRTYYQQNCANDDKISDVKCFDDFYNQSEQNKQMIDYTLDMFAFAAQTVLDPVDPYNVASLVDKDAPVFAIQSNQDTTIPNTVKTMPTAGGQPLLAKLQLSNTMLGTQGKTKLASYFKHAKHSTVIAPDVTSEKDPAAHKEMASEIVKFTLSKGNKDGNFNVKNDDDLLDNTINTDIN
ncbi:fumarate hydrolyase [Vibrio azureus]|uniref:Putative lipase n=1 Tax=Vibrio azureus NBRC 104587 TaxID=1219077 RepID=U3AMC9_9VIBR|nr:VolA/Pla-1 family phospholipase [Vibrio azureus]AUI88180.1 fumarate hydrolyase [Vibrio azureus]GAD74925.1 putative lipase [Vibrio azureus NBRC 104587]